MYGWIPWSHVGNACRNPADSAHVESLGLQSQQLDIHLYETARQIHEPGTQPAEETKRLVTPAVRRGDEHHAFYKRERLKDQRMGYQLPSFSAYGELLRWNSKRPEMRPTIDGGHFRKQTSLAMPDHDHLFESRIFSLGIELCHRFCQS